MEDIIPGRGKGLRPLYQERETLYKERAQDGGHYTRKVPRIKTLYQDGGYYYRMRSRMGNIITGSVDGIVPPKTPLNNNYIICIVVAICISIFLLGIFNGVIGNTLCRNLKKDKSKGNDEPQCSTDEDRETTDKPLGKHEDGPMVTERDVLENANISTPGPVDVVINIEPDKDVAISSDRKHEEQTKIVIDVAPHGPMVEKREILNSTMIPMPDARDAVINMDPDEDAVTAPDRKHENKLNIGNYEAPHGPLAEKSDHLKNIKISPGRVSDLVAKYKAYQNAIAKFHRKHEGKTNIVTDVAPHGPMVEKREILNSTMIPVPDADDEVINMRPDEDAVTAPDRKHENKLNIGNYEAPRGPLAEKSDHLKNIKISPGRVSDLVAKYKAYQNAIAKFDRKHENKRNIGNYEAPRGPLAGKRDNLKTIEIPFPSG
ncbi:uncharacterized protein LOC143809122 isoform X2 [Ranitomeya variabilis]|uniref:uncharacterized protein LOC143809122 isoform X2 n=1 Tax=Ranitomeya variabilis TaxID=490064 RepID=UPI004055E424